MLTPSSWTTDTSCCCRSAATLTSNASSWNRKRQKSGSETGQGWQVEPQTSSLTVSPSFFLVTPENTSITPRWYSWRTRDRAHD